MRHVTTHPRCSMSSTQAATATTAGDTRYKVLGAISLSHFLNDLLQQFLA